MEGLYTGVYLSTYVCILVEPRYVAPLNVSSGFAIV